MLNSALYRSFLIAPANRLDMLLKFHRFAPDVGVIDLEDGTPLNEKESARDTAVQAAEQLATTSGPTRIFVRTNAPGTVWIDDDLEAVAKAPIAGIVIPKLGTTRQIVEIERRLRALEVQNSRPPMEIILGIESVSGVHNIVDIATHSTRACAVYFGAEDYATDLLGYRTTDGEEVLYARSRVAIAARLSSIAAFDTATLEIRDDDRFRHEARQGRNLGYQGRICVHPRQVELSHEIFSPSEEELDRSTRLLAANDASLAKGIAVCEFEGQMIDGPLVKRAQHIVALATRYQQSTTGA